MSHVTPFEFFHAIYPEPVRPGQLALHTRTIRGGKLRVSWCCSLREAARQIRRVRNTRSIEFGVALQDPVRALSIARGRRKNAARGSVRGTADTVTALPALWAEIAISRNVERPSDPERTARDMPELSDTAGVPNHAAAIRLLGAVPEPPAIVISNRRRLAAYWRLEELWVLDTASERAEAIDLLRRLQWAIELRARDLGWRVPAAGDLAQALPVPGTLTRADRPAIERFPLSDSEGRLPRGAFAALAEPPAAPSLHIALTESAPTPALEPPVALAPVWHGCAFLRAAHAQAASLPRRPYLDAVSILARCAAPGFSGRELAHHLGRPHPGYAPAATDEHVAQALNAPDGPSTCRQIFEHCRSAAENAAAECYEDADDPAPPRPEIAGVSPELCQRCPHRARAGSPLDLGEPSPPPASPALAAAPPVPAEPRATAGRAVAGRAVAGRAVAGRAVAGRAEATTRRKETIVITADTRGVNDRALTALVAGVSGVAGVGGAAGVAGHRLFEHLGRLVEVVAGSPAAPAAPAEPIVKPVSEARLRELLSQHCTFLRDGRPVPPPRWTTRGLLSRGSWPELPWLADAAGESPSPNLSLEPQGDPA